MSLGSMQTDASLLFLLLTICWGILDGQTVLPGVGECGTVPIRISPQVVLDDTVAQNSSLDSLELCLLQVEIARAEERMAETSFWRRIIPQIHFSASFGMHDLMFIDPTSFTPYILPRDSYRLTISLSLNDVLTSPAHTQAVLDLQRLRGELALRTIRNAHAYKVLEQQSTSLREQLESLEKELMIVQELLHFNELRFQQGQIQFDALARTKLELLGVQRSIQRIHQQQSEIRLKVSGVRLQ